MKVALAVTVHDPAASIAPGMRRTAKSFREVFSALAADVTEATHIEVLSALEDAGAWVMTHPVGNVAGRSRRRAVKRALHSDAERILYSDLDHVIRWIERDRNELEALISRTDAADLVIVGRSDAAFTRSPARLRDTEARVNRVYKLLTGLDADLLFAIRLLTRQAAEAIVRECTEDTMSSDVEWPIVAEQRGLSVEYVAAEGLDYRTTADFDQSADGLDLDPQAWIYRVELAAQHVRVMQRLMSGRPDKGA